jgi:hypothetical protein
LLQDFVAAPLALLLNELRAAYLREEARREAKLRNQQVIDALEALKNHPPPDVLPKQSDLERFALEVQLAAPRQGRVLESAAVAHRTRNTLRATVATLTGLACALLCFGFLSPTPVFTSGRLRSLVGGAFRRPVRA